MKSDLLPKLSIIIPVYNEERNLVRLIPSLTKQRYPRNKLEYIFVDDNSTDSSKELAKKIGAKIISVNTHDIELNKGIGMYASTGEFIYWLDADMEICCNNYFNLLVKPLLDNNDLIGSFTNEFALDCMPVVKNSLLRFISYDPLQRDPVYQYFSPSIVSTIVENKQDYFICNFIPGKIPPSGRIMYRKKKLLKTDVRNNKSFIDLESLEIVARAGYQKFAYVPKAKIRHFHATTLTQLIHKRLRNLQRDYLPNLSQKYYTWFDPSDKSEIIKIIWWTIYANLFIPELMKGIWKSIHYKDLALLWQPVVSISTTDAIIYGFISQPSGRNLIRSLCKRILLR